MLNVCCAPIISSNAFYESDEELESGSELNKQQQMPLSIEVEVSIPEPKMLVNLLKFNKFSLKKLLNFVIEPMWRKMNYFNKTRKLCLITSLLQTVKYFLLLLNESST